VPRPDWLPWAVMYEHAGRVKSCPDRPCLKTQPRCRRRLASSHTRHPDRATSHARSRTRRRPSVVPLSSVPPPLSGGLRRREILHGERSPEHPPLRLFLRGLLSRASSPPSTPMQDHRRSPESSPCRRTPPSIWFSPLPIGKKLW
jgi:hypothetical protein